MKILLTGGAGDLGKVLAYQIEKRGNTALRFDIRKPTIQDISETKKWLGYKPSYRLMSLLEDLSKYGEAGPPTIESIQKCIQQ